MTALERVEQEFGEPAEEVIRDFATWTDHTGLGYSMDFTCKALDIPPQTLRRFVKKHNIKFGFHHGYNKQRDHCWVKWGCDMEKFIMRHRLFTKNELCVLLDCKRGLIDKYREKTGMIGCSWIKMEE